MSIFEIIGIGVTALVAIGSAGAVILFFWATMIADRIGILGRKTAPRLSIAKWTDTKFAADDYSLDDFPLKWVRGITYRTPWNKRSFIFMFGSLEPMRGRNMTGKTHPAEEV